MPSELLAIFSVAVFTRMIGLIPPLGPGRAAWLILRTKLMSRFNETSCVRTAEIGVIRDLLRNRNRTILICGRQGVGKTRLLEAAISNSVVFQYLNFVSDRSSDKIVASALDPISRINYSFVDPIPSAKRVLYFYRLFTGNHSPVIRFSRYFYKSNVVKEPHHFVRAVNRLVEDYKLNVVIDGYPEEFSARLLGFEDSIVYNVEPESAETISKLPQLQKLFQLLRQEKLDQLIYRIIGGDILEYQSLWCMLLRPPLNGDSFNADTPLRDKLGCLIIRILLDAERLASNTMLKYPHREEIRALYVEHDGLIPMQKLIDLDIKRPDNDVVFIAIRKDGGYYITAASNPIDIILRHNWTA